MTGHFQKLQQWLEWEAAAEAEQFQQQLKSGKGNSEASGRSLLDLVVTDHDPGIGGRLHLTLVKRNRQLPMPWTRLRVGAPILLTNAAATAVHGVVIARNRDSISISVGDWPEGDRFRIDASPDEITRKRQRAALDSVQKQRGRTGALRDILLGIREPQFLSPPDVECSGLNESQADAVNFALSATDLAVLHGPPGTGKTTTLVELICQAVARGDKVIACAPSNTAVDNLLARLIAARQKVVRLGHPARVDPRLQDATLDVQAADHEVMGVVRDMLREAESLFRKAGRFTRAKPAPGSKRESRREARQLRADARLLERQAVQSVLDRADVVCATTAFDATILGDRRFDLAVIDEACQSTEPGIWIPVLHAERLVLAGDHCQLPPTVISSQAMRDGMQISLLERLVQHFGAVVTRRLDTQYRMHADIMQFSSDQFYEGTLQAHASVAAHRLGDLPHVAVTDDDEPLCFIDTAGAGWDEEAEPEGSSRRNPQEAELVLETVRRLQSVGVRTRDIAVITPYAAQVRWLREHWPGAELEIDTVDGFQGREKEAVLISCVRSNPRGEIGFLADTRRMNVALTRARRKLIVVGDSATIGGHDFYASLLEYFENLGAYRTVWEL